MKISNLKELRDLYGYPSGRAKDKVLTSLDKHCINFIHHAPFLVLSSCDKKGKLDASPRGGHPGFVKIVNASQIIIPDAKGNNRVDSLGNIIQTEQIGLLFLIPGMDETLRVNGHAYLSTSEDHLALFSSEKNKPKCCIIVDIKEVFLHCAKALMRSRLWDMTSQIKRDSFPTMGEMLKDQLGTTEDPESQIDMINRYKQDL
ncbi:pyridoxamine 5'-phosphate oxidase family protein [Aestuariivivens sediminicola]|uniref:pyridoxamine 5'-phosphate oxidase family protein n=1 Tax=Aestuariivivens sediminicola TaxID=2913560 RepID=UPI001F58142B|nr:pyridoxamine 5'-phosphate oxidase family protein [Aestuariivivens sediminicola]